MTKLSIQNITKTYKDTLALNDISLTLSEPKIYGLLGRNGAGKTTLINLITNKIYPTSGDILIDDESVTKDNKSLLKVYSMIEKNMYPTDLKVADIFKWTKEFRPDFDLDYAYILSKKFNLNTNKKFKQLSTGYSSIFKLITTLSSNAPIMLFDEPVLGLDANHRDLFYKELLANFIKSPKIIILSTHLIDEVANILEDIIIIKEGNIIIHESIDELLSRGYSVSGATSNVDEYISDKQVIGYDNLGGLKSAYILNNNSSTDTDLTQLGLIGLEKSQLDLQKLFIHLTNN